MWRGSLPIDRILWHWVSALLSSRTGLCNVQCILTWKRWRALSGSWIRVIVASTSAPELTNKSATSLMSFVESLLVQCGATIKHYIVNLPALILFPLQDPQAFVVEVHCCLGKSFRLTLAVPHFWAGIWPCQRLRFWPLCEGEGNSESEELSLKFPGNMSTIFEYVLNFFELNCARAKKWLLT